MGSAGRHCPCGPLGMIRAPCSERSAPSSMGLTVATAVRHDACHAYPSGHPLRRAASKWLPILHVNPDNHVRIDSVLTDAESLIKLIYKTPISVQEWERQRNVYLNPKDYSDFELGFAAFYLNRTNRSGIIKGGGVIGGLSQTGSYKMDCRFNRSALGKRIHRIAKYRSRIHLYCKDAQSFLDTIDSVLPRRSFFCIDPPYFSRGESLYTSFYKEEDHLAVSQTVLGLEHPWILTYDNAPEISALYNSRRQYGFDVKYSVQTKRVGTELLIASKGLKIPADVRDRQLHRPQYRAA